MKRAGTENMEDLMLPCAAGQLRTLLGLCVFRRLYLPNFFLNDIINKLYSKNRKEKLELLRGLRLGRDDNTVNNISSLSQEVLIVWGEHDKIFLLEKAIELSKYLFVRWRLNVSNMFVILGETGGMDYEELIAGTHKTMIMKGSWKKIFISRDGGNKKYASVLAPGQHKDLGKTCDQGISSWGWNLTDQHSTYHALFPRAWTIYDGEPDPDLKISCRQISPFIPHNYRESSLPTAVFVYTFANTGKDRAKVNLLFTWANSIGGISHMSGDHVNEPFIVEDGVSGVLLHHK